MAIRGKTPLQLAYTAGLFDGEGYISILRITGTKQLAAKGKRNTWHELTVGMNITTPEATKWMADRWGGTNILHPTIYPNRKRIHMWRISQVMARDFLTDLLPYLKIKREEAVLAIEFQALKSFRFGRAGIPEANLKRRDEIWYEMRRRHGTLDRYGGVARRD